MMHFKASKFEVERYFSNLKEGRYESRVHYGQHSELGDWAGCLIGIHGLRVEMVVGGREVSTADVAPCGNLWKEVVPVGQLRHSTMPCDFSFPEL